MIRVLHIYPGSRRRKRIKLPHPMMFEGVFNAGETISVLTSIAEFYLGYEDEAGVYRTSTIMYKEPYTMEEFDV